MAQKRITDEQLREDIEAGLTPSQIADKHGMHRQSIGERVRKLTLTTAVVATLAPVASPETRTYVETKRDAIAELLDLLDDVKKLRAACVEWLTDAEDPEKFDIGARSQEIIVTYWDFADIPGPNGGPRLVKKKAPLDVLLSRVEKKGLEVDRAETKHADPRTLILQTAQECRQIIKECKELALLMADARAMETLRESLLSEITKVSPDIAQAVSDAVRRILVLHVAAGGPGQLTS